MTGDHFARLLVVARPFSSCYRGANALCQRRTGYRFVKDVNDPDLSGSLAHLPIDKSRAESLFVAGASLGVLVGMLL
jgi:hypothetical protein